MQCMLIDDDIPTVQVLREIIPWPSYGFTDVSQAHCVQDAQMLFAAGVPDLVICDIEMPRGSGIEMIQWIREQGYDCAFIFLHATKALILRPRRSPSMRILICSNL